MLDRKTARNKLAEANRILDDYHSRINELLLHDFEFKLRNKNNLLLSRPYFSSSNSIFDNKTFTPETHVIVVAKNKLNEFLRLKEEFESEYIRAQEYVEILKPQFFTDRYNVSDANLKNSLIHSAQFFSIRLDHIKKFDIYQV